MSIPVDHSCLAVSIAQGASQAERNQALLHWVDDPGFLRFVSHCHPFRRHSPRV